MYECKILEVELPPLLWRPSGDWFDSIEFIHCVVFATDEAVPEMGVFHARPVIISSFVIPWRVR